MDTVCSNGGYVVFKGEDIFVLPEHDWIRDFIYYRRHEWGPNLTVITV